MAIFEIQGPDGKTYEVEADSIEQAAQAFAPQGKQPAPESPPWGYVGEPGNYRPDVKGGGRLAAGARNAFQGMTFGFGDEIVAGATSLLPGRTYDEELARERERLRQNREDYPGLSTAGEIGGALATALLPVGAGANAATRAGQAAPRVAQVAAKAPLATRMTGSAAAGAGMSGLYGFGAGEGGLGSRAESARDAAILGGTVGAGIPLIGGAGQRLLNARAGNRAIKAAARAGKTTDEVFDEGRAYFKAIDDAGISVKPESAIRGYGETAIDLGQQGAARTYRGGVEHPMPRSAAMFQMAQDQAENAVSKPSIPWRDIDLDSRVFRNTAASNPGNRVDTRAARAGSGKFENWLLGLGPDDVASGNPAVLTENLPLARDAWSRARKSEMIEDAVERGQNYLSGGASGIKNRIKSILNNEKLAAQFTPAERAAMRRIIDGTPAEKFIDTFGSGLGQMATTAAGGAIGNAGGPVGTIAGIGVGAGVGQAARRASEAMAMRNAELARAAIASGKLTGDLPVADPMKRAIIEQLLRGQVAVGAN